MIIKFELISQAANFIEMRSRMEIWKVHLIYKNGSETNLSLEQLYDTCGIIIPATRLQKGCKTAVKVVQAENAHDFR